jgi:signal recognition particle GTPase
MEWGEVVAITESYKNYIFIGESGSGKTELSVNFAIHLAKYKNKAICFFDMDQTKGIFRARDLQSVLKANGVRFYDTVDFMDAPIVPSGISGVLREKESVCVFDLGGNAAGARMIGQYTDNFSENTTCAFYVINPYRPFTSNWEDIDAGM